MQERTEIPISCLGPRQRYWWYTTLRGDLVGRACRRRRRGPQVRQERGQADDPASGQRGGTRVAGVGTRVGTSVPTSVGVQGLGHGGAGPGPPGLRSLPAKQHAPKARPLPATDRGRRGVVPGRPSKANGCAVGTCATAGCRTFALDRRASRPASTTSLPAIMVASTPGEGGPSPGPHPERAAAAGCTSPGGRQVAASWPWWRARPPRAW
jgi:hypothetical protein